MKTGDKVTVNMGHRVVEGIVVKYTEGSKYIIVKHDNFAGEVFDLDQVSKHE